VDATDTTVISIHVLTALLDSRSTHNFVDLNTAECIDIMFGDQAGLRVTMANGERIRLV
jgi:hypothetical protein